MLNLSVALPLANVLRLFDPFGHKRNDDAIPLPPMAWGLRAQLLVRITHG